MSQFERLSTEEFVREAKRRANSVLQRKKIRAERIFTVCAAVLCLALITGLSFGLPAAAPTVSIGSGANTATMLVSGSEGGYILMGVISFILGVLVTLICIRFADKNNKDK